MKVILLDYVYKHGVAGEVIDVADGFARNFLIPRGLAVKATAGELKRASKLREQAVAKRAALEQRLHELAQEIDGVELVFERRAAVTGKLFGSVTTQEIADALLEKTGVDINRRRISQQSLRELGAHDVPVRLGTEDSPNLNVVIIREGQMGEYLKAKEAGEAYVPEGTEIEAESVTDTPIEDEATPEPTEPDGEEETGVDTENMQTEVLPRSELQAKMDAIQQAQDAEETPEDES